MNIFNHFYSVVKDRLRFVFVFSFLFFLLTACSSSHKISQFIEPETLIVSNYPEEIIEPGLVFQKKLTNKPIRTLFYHKNVYKADLYLAVLVKNTTNRAIKIKTMKACSGPNIEGIFTGHMASKNFLTLLNNNQYEEKIIPPKMTISLINQLIKPNQISSGIIKIRAEKKGLIFKMLVAEDKFLNLVDFNDQKKVFKVGVFEHPYKIIKKKIKGLESVKEFALGNTPFLKDKKSKIVLQGNYGVFYIYQINVINRNDWYKKINIYFSPTAGGVRGFLLINDKFVETGFFDVKHYLKPEKVFDFILEPKHNKKIEIITMPEPGSYYPVKLIFQSAN